jgi:hypothetical protein
MRTRSLGPYRTPAPREDHAEPPPGGPEDGELAAPLLLLVAGLSGIAISALVPERTLEAGLGVLMALAGGRALAVVRRATLGSR